MVSFVLSIPRLLSNSSNTVEHSAATAKNIYLNRYIENFLNVQFGSALDYVMGRQRFMKDTLFESTGCS